MAKEEFYIGWQDETPLGFAKAGRKFVVFAISLALGFAFFFTRSESQFVDNYFDYGNLTTLEGQLILDPIPSLLVNDGGKLETIPLVGFGKFGAIPTLDAYGKKSGRKLSSGDLITLRGTIFTYQDKRWMELTEGHDSVIGTPSDGVLKRNTENLGSVSLSGEIVDPKCFFGVMNPAVKAVHRSCAIRCISGGIPAILAIRSNGVFTDYYFLLDETGKPVGNEILPMVGIPVTLEGNATSIQDWKTLTIKSENIQLAFDGEDSAYLCL